MWLDLQIARDAPREPLLALQMARDPSALLLSSQSQPLLPTAEVHHPRRIANGTPLVQEQPASLAAQGHFLAGRFGLLRPGLSAVLAVPPLDQVGIRARLSSLRE